MKIERFEEIEAWKEARVLVSEIYKKFNGCRDFDLKKQVQRAAVSIMSNIAEGFERKTDKEFANFLSIARGSLAEVKSLLYSALDLKFIAQESFFDLKTRIDKINGLLNGFIQYLKKNPKKR